MSEHKYTNCSDTDRANVYYCDRCTRLEISVLGNEVMRLRNGIAKTLESLADESIAAEDYSPVDDLKKLLT